MLLEEKIETMGLVLPKPLQIPKGVRLPFNWVRVSGNKAYISGHLPLKDDGSLSDLKGKVGDDLSIEEGYESAKLTALAVLSSLKRELGSLDKISAWLRVFGMVNTAKGFVDTAPVINGFSDTIIQIFGREIGMHSRAAVGMAELPFGMPVEVEAEVELYSD